MGLKSHNQIKPVYVTWGNYFIFFNKSWERVYTSSATLVEHSSHLFLHTSTLLASLQHGQRNLTSACALTLVQGNIQSIVFQGPGLLNSFSVFTLKRFQSTSLKVMWEKHNYRYSSITCQSELHRTCTIHRN